ncbi:hypothetical protein [Aeromicrobium sp. P5_D10]
MDHDDTETPGLHPVLLAGGAAVIAAIAIALRGRGAGRAIAETAPVLAESAGAASERVAQEFQALGDAYNMAAMDQTVAKAVSRFQRWTPEELEVLRDAGKTALEKALELGRTYNGVRAKAIRIGAISKAPNEFR